jgi:hypothetical protein
MSTVMRVASAAPSVPLLLQDASGIMQSSIVHKIKMLTIFLFIFVCSFLNGRIDCIK